MYTAAPRLLSSPEDLVPDTFEQPEHVLIGLVDPRWSHRDRQGTTLAYTKRLGKIYGD